MDFLEYMQLLKTKIGSGNNKRRVRTRVDRPRGVHAA